jgi:hypothetical protein
MPVGSSAVATLLGPGAGGSTTAGTQSASRGAPLSGASGSREETSAGNFAGGLASLVGGLEEAMAASRGPARGDRSGDGLDPKSVDQLLTGGKPRPADPQTTDMRLQGLARTLYQVGVDAAREVGRRLQLSGPRETPAPGPGRPAGLDHPLAGPSDHEDEPPSQEESGADPSSVEGGGDHSPTWEASLAVPLLLLSAGQHVPRRRAATELAAGNQSVGPGSQRGG